MSSTNPRHGRNDKASLIVTTALLLFLTGLGLYLGSITSSHAAPKAAVHVQVKPRPVTYPREPSGHHRAPGVVAVRTYTIRTGDTLWGISVAHCGTGTDYTALWRGNKIIRDPDEISPGQVITLTC